MPQAANITLADGAATPVNHVFAVEQATPALSTFVDRSVSTALGFKRLSLSCKFAGSKSTVNRSTMRLEVPVTATADGVTSVAYICRAELNFILPNACTEADRKDIFAFVKNSLSNPSIMAVLRDYDPFY